MKMSEVFKLPLRFESLWLWSGSSNLAMFNQENGEAICEAVNSHDTHLADIDRLLDRLEPFAGIYKTDVKLWQERRGDEYTAMSGYDMKKSKAVKITAKQFDLAHQTYTELREKYPAVADSPTKEE